jgi:hypothetical protein
MLTLDDPAGDVLGLLEAAIERPTCQRVQTCFTVVQREAFRLLFRDMRISTFSTGVNVSAAISRNGEAFPLVVKPSTRVAGLFEISLTEGNILSVGTFVTTLQVNGAHVESSPFFFSVVSPICSSSLQEPDSGGNCVCAPSKASTLGGACVAHAVLFPIVALAVLLASAVGLAAFSRHTKRQADRVWQVDLKELEFPDPPVVLGKGMARGLSRFKGFGQNRSYLRWLRLGSFGEVVEGTYRNTNVAVKRLAALGKRRFSRAGSRSRSRTGSRYEISGVNFDLGRQSRQLGTDGSLAGSSGRQSFSSATDAVSSRCCECEGGWGDACLVLVPHPS